MIINSKLNLFKNPYFQSKIHVSNSEYNELNLKEKSRKKFCVDDPWSIYEAKYFDSWGFSDKASCCTIGVIKSNKKDKFFMFHLAPYCLGTEATDKIQEVINTFKKDQGAKITAFLTGGSEKLKSSKAAYEKIMSILDNSNVEYSAILGRKSKNLAFEDGGEDLYFSLPKDEFILKCTGCNKKIQSEKNLKNSFDVVKISKSDEVII